MFAVVIVVVTCTTYTAPILMMVKERRLLFKLEHLVAPIDAIHVQTDKEEHEAEVGDAERKEVLPTEVVVDKVTVARVKGTVLKT